MARLALDYININPGAIYGHGRLYRSDDPPSFMRLSCSTLNAIILLTPSAFVAFLGLPGRTSA